MKSSIGELTTLGAMTATMGLDWALRVIQKEIGELREVIEAANNGNGISPHGKRKSGPPKALLEAREAMARIHTVKNPALVAAGKKSGTLAERRARTAKARAALAQKHVEGKTSKFNAWSNLSPAERAARRKHLSEARGATIAKKAAAKKAVAAS